MLSALIVSSKPGDPRLGSRLGVALLLVRFLLQRLDLRLHLLLGLLRPRLHLLQRLFHASAKLVNAGLQFCLSVAAFLGKLCFELVDFGTPGGHLARTTLIFRGTLELAEHNSAESLHP